MLRSNSAQFRTDQYQDQPPEAARDLHYAYIGYMDFLSGTLQGDYDSVADWKWELDNDEYVRNIRRESQDVADVCGFDLI